MNFLCEVRNKATTMCYTHPERCLPSPSLLPGHARSLLGAGAATLVDIPAWKDDGVSAYHGLEWSVNRGKICFLADPAKLINEVKTFLFDLDGVIWRGGNVIEGVPETLDMLRNMGKKLLFVTNNSTKSRRMFQENFRSLGLNISEEEVFSSSFAAASYLRSLSFPTEKKVYVVGEEGIQEELAQAGVQYLGGPEDGEKKLEMGSGKDLDFDRDVAAVVVGFDHHINYYKMVYATLCIRENPGCLFIATNCDSVAHFTDRQEWPAGGTMVGSIRASTGQDPIVVGKPSTFMMDYLSRKFSISRSEMCMVGDRLDTDILFGQAGGCKTLLVLSGVTDQNMLFAQGNTIHPDYYTNQLSDFLSAKRTTTH